MKEWDDQIIILRLGLFHESDLWLRVLSRAEGLLTLFAFGGAKSVHRFCGCLDKFNTLQCRIKGSRRGYLNLQEASLITGPRILRKDWRKMGIASNCIRFMEAMRIDADCSESAFNLLEDLREKLENSKQPARLTTFFFRLNLASLLGFAPDLEKCAICGRDSESNYFFIPEEGRTFCAHCLHLLEDGLKRHAMRVGRSVLNRLCEVRFLPPSQWKEEDLDESEKRLCARIIDWFIRYHLGLAWENGTFRSV